MSVMASRNHCSASGCRRSSKVRSCEPGPPGRFIYPSASFRPISKRKQRRVTYGTYWRDVPNETSLRGVPQTPALTDQRHIARAAAGREGPEERSGRPPCVKLDFRQASLHPEVFFMAPNHAAHR